MRKFFQRHHEALSFLWKEVYLKHKSYFFWSFFALIFSSGVGVLLPYLAKLELDQLEAKKSTIFGASLDSPLVVFALILGAIFVTNLIENVISFFFSLKTQIKKEVMNYELKKEIFARIYTIDPGYTLMNRFSRMMRDMSSVINGLPGQIESILQNYISTIIEVIAIIAVISFFDWRIFIVIVVAGFLNYLINQYTEYYERRHQLSNTYELNWEVNTIEHTVESSYHHIASNGATKMLFDRYFSLKGQQIESTKKQQKIHFFSRTTSDIVNSVATLAVKLFVGYLIFKGSGSIGLMTMTTMYMERISRATRQFFRAFSDRYDIMEHFSILQFFLAFVDEKGKKRTNTLPSSPRDLTIDHLTFSYPKPAQMEIDFLDIKINTLKRILKKDKDDWNLDDLHTYEEAKKEAQKPNPTILKDISLSFEKGKLYGIVGKNGAGKTTLTSVILGFFSEYHGVISINGTDISTLERHHLQTLCGYVSQEPYIMQGRFTIRDNLTLGVDPQVSDDELYQYLDLFGMKKKIEKEREGLNTRLKWDMDLSGGQKQIIALIRIILQDRPILILDEGTNQLDAENEMRVMNELLKNRKDKIIIFVTHRMNTMKKCDFIYTLQDGIIEDAGTPKELALRDNAFKQFLDIGEQEF